MARPARPPRTPTSAADISGDIRARGFRRWYERELVRSHAHLVLLLMCALAALGAVEAFSSGRGDRALMLGSLLVAAAVGAWALRRYLFLLMRAELLANQATCPQCRCYARWQVEHEGTPDPGGGGGGDDSSGAITAGCRNCRHRWRIRW